jgi:hypothetical protein
VDSQNKKVENTIKEIRESQAEKEKTKLAREDSFTLKSLDKRQCRSAGGEDNP